MPFSTSCRKYSRPSTICFRKSTRRLRFPTMTRRLGKCFFCRFAGDKDDYVDTYDVCRLLADAQYLHRNLSALSNVRAPTAMLETVVLEKSPRTQPTTSGSATVNGTNSSTATIANPSIGSTSSPGVNATPPRPTAPTRSQTLTANQRIMGLFNSRATGSATASPPPERAQPPAPSTQSRTPSPPPVPPEADKPLSPIPPGLDAGRIGNSVYGSVLSQEQIVSMSGSALTMHVSPIPRLDGGPLGPMDSTSSLPIAPDEDG